MKKLIALLLILSAAVFSIMWYQDYQKYSHVNEIHIYKAGNTEPEHSYLKKDIQSISKIMDIFNKQDDPVSVEHTPVSSERSYSVTINMREGEAQKYDLYIDLDDLRLNIHDRTTGTYVYPAKDDVITLLSMEGFHDLYIDKLPLVNLMNSSITIPTLVVGSEWSFKLLDGIFHKENASLDYTTGPYIIPIDHKEGIRLSCFDMPDLATLKVYKEDVLTREETILDGRFQPSKIDGTLRYDIVCQWQASGNRSYFGQTTYSFYGTVDVEPELVLGRYTARAGDIVPLEVLHVNDDQDVRIDQSLSKDLKLWKADDKYFAFLALDYWVEEGDHVIALVISNDDGSSFTKKYLIQIEPRTFETQHLTINEDIEARTRTEEAYREYDEVFKPVRAHSIEDKLWEGIFIQPVEGRISTEFGERRYVNGSLTSYRHSGVDLAVPLGTEIAATNTGVVKMAQELTLTGKTVVMDHGYGIFSAYYHLDTISVSVGQTVNKGETIGTVGSTGFSTGPHLHWMISHYNTDLNPWPFLENHLIFLE